MKHWVFTFRVEPPAWVVSARTGGSVFFAAYSRIIDQWYLCANGTEEIIDPPDMLYLDEEYVRSHPRDLVKHPIKHTSLRPEKTTQLKLF
jgi:hypothetical protein